MSLDLQIRGPHRSLAPVQDLLDAAGAVVRGQPPEGGPWSDGLVLWLWVPERSTRPLELIAEEAGARLRVLPLSCDADLALAIELAAQLAGAGGTIQLGAEIHSPAALRAHCGPAWRHARAAEDLSTLRRLVTDGTTVAIGGPRRDTWLGPWVWSLLEAVAPTQRWPALMERIRGVQYPGNIHQPGALEISEAGAEAPVRVAEVIPRVPTLLPPVELVGLMLDQQRYLTAETLLRTLRTLGLPARRLDERQWLVPAMASEQWDRLAAALRETGDWVESPRTYRPTTSTGALRLPAGPMVPVLRPADWDHADAQLCRPLATGAPDLPLVSWSVDTGEALVSVPSSGPAAARNPPHAIEARALATLTGLDPAWQPLPDPMGMRDADGMASRMEHAAAMLVCPPQLRAIQATLGASQLLVCAPVREIMMVQDAWLEPVLARTARLMERATELTQRAQADGHPFVIGPQVFLVDDGRVVGRMRAVGVEELGPAPPWPERGDRAAADARPAPDPDPDRSTSVPAPPQERPRPPSGHRDGPTTSPAASLPDAVLAEVPASRPPPPPPPDPAAEGEPATPTATPKSPDDGPRRLRLRWLRVVLGLAVTVAVLWWWTTG